MNLHIEATESESQANRSKLLFFFQSHGAYLILNIMILSSSYYSPFIQKVIKKNGVNPKFC